MTRRSEPSAEERPAPSYRRRRILVGLVVLLALGAAVVGGRALLDDDDPRGEVGAGDVELEPEDANAVLEGLREKIGRASCRERV